MLHFPTTSLKSAVYSIVTQHISAQSTLQVLITPLDYGWSIRQCRCNTVILKCDSWASGISITTELD